MNIFNLSHKFICFLIYILILLNLTLSFCKANEIPSISFKKAGFSEVKLKKIENIFNKSIENKEIP